MVDKIKLKVKLVDKHKIFPMKAKYDPQTRIAEVTKGLKKTVSERFEIDPDHIYEEFKGIGNRKEYVVYADNANRKSIAVTRAKEIIEDGQKRVEDVTEDVDCAETVKLHNEDPIDNKKRNTLNYLTQASFWKSLLEKRKLPLTTVLLILLAGVGLYHFILMILHVFGFQV
jgi:hypothetical protein